MFITIYSTHKNKAEAKRITKVLLEKKLVACATFFPIESSFWWKGKINNANEIVALLTTKESNWNKVKNEIKKMHSYRVPCIEKTKFVATKEYGDWITSTTK